MSISLSLSLPLGNMDDSSRVGDISASASISSSNSGDGGISQSNSGQGGGGADLGVGSWMGIGTIGSSIAISSISSISTIGGVGQTIAVSSVESIGISLSLDEGDGGKTSNGQEFVHDVKVVTLPTVGS